jgi:hypothetical protein
MAKFRPSAFLFCYNLHQITPLEFPQAEPQPFERAYKTRLAQAKPFAAAR